MGWWVRFASVHLFKHGKLQHGIGREELTDTSGALGHPQPQTLVCLRHSWPNSQLQNCWSSFIPSQSLGIPTSGIPRVWVLLGHTGSRFGFQHFSPQSVFPALSLKARSWVAFSDVFLRTINFLSRSVFFPYERLGVLWNPKVLSLKQGINEFCLLKFNKRRPTSFEFFFSYRNYLKDLG